MQKHYHIVDASPWPILTAFSLLLTAVGLVNWIHQIDTYMVRLGGLLTGLCFITWLQDVLRESHAGKHSSITQKGFTIGWLLFLVSEIMLFFSFFWAYFHSSLSPNIELGCNWPPTDVVAIDPLAAPLLGTLVLLCSGFTVTLAHHAIKTANKDITVLSLFATVLLGALFVFLQLGEYQSSEYTISDSVYGSVFYMTTGLHGLHVIIGTLFLAVCLYRLVRDMYTTERHLGFEYAIFYWHLVDVVWFLVFFVFYGWGSF